MKRLLVVIIGPMCAVILASCETSLKSAPPVTPAFVRAAARREMADAQTLEAGRKVFLNRCIACHALPDVTQQDSARIPRIVGWMSNRAHLTSEQHAALVKYLLAVKSQSR
jgi:mono/diheme cytochrome c family protein